MLRASYSRCDAGRGTMSSRVRTLGALRFVRHQVELGRHLAELGKRTSIHFPHRLAAVDLHGSLGDTDVAGDLLAKASPRDVNHDFSLPRAQGRDALSQVGQCAFSLPTDTITRQAELNSIKKLLIAYWLGEGLDRAPLPGLHPP